MSAVFGFTRQWANEIQRTVREHRRQIDRLLSQRRQWRRTLDDQMVVRVPANAESELYAHGPNVLCTRCAPDGSELPIVEVVDVHGGAPYFVGSAIRGRVVQIECLGGTWVATAGGLPLLRVWLPAPGFAAGAAAQQHLDVPYNDGRNPATTIRVHRGDLSTSHAKVGGVWILWSDREQRWEIGDRC